MTLARGKDDPCRPFATEYRCFIKEDSSFMVQRVRISHRGSKILRLPYNSPFWQHFTRDVLLCLPILYTI